jgi:DNA-binding NarL/FixJ family response regulator
MKLVYQNQASREFCALWQKGPDIARIFKADAPIPREILDGCHNLKARWRQNRQSPQLKPAAAWKALVHHPKRQHLRASLSLRQINSVAVARPHFFIECESLKRATKQSPKTRLPHMARLTQREQELTLLVCEGRNNQEIADTAAVSLAMVKKHLHSIFGKLEIASRSQLMALMR